MTKATDRKEEETPTTSYYSTRNAIFIGGGVTALLLGLLAFYTAGFILTS